MRNLDMLLSAGRQPITFQEEGIANVKTLSRQLACHVQDKVAGTERMKGRILRDETKELSRNQII